MKVQEENVYQVTKKILSKLKAQEELASGKAALAALRHSIGKPLGKSPAVCSILLENMPETFLSKNGIETRAERAIYAALQLYAIQKQGRRGKEENDTVKNIGEALRKIREDAGQEAMDRRFVLMLSATSFDDLLYRLRQLMKLAKGKNALPIDIAVLANDLFCYLMGAEERVCLRWAEAYYQIEKKKEDK